MKIEEKLYEDIWNDAYRESDMPTSIAQEVTGTIRIDAMVTYVTPADYLLDIGCGDGLFCEIVKSKFKKCYGIDISPTAVRKAVKRGVTAVAHNLHDGPIPFPDGQFNLITASAVIEHIFEPSTLLIEAKRLLKRGGKIIIGVPNIRYLRYLFSLVFLGKFPKTSGDLSYSYDGGHLHYFTVRDLAILLKKHNFNVVDSFGINTPDALRHPLYKLLSLLGTNFEREFLSCEIFIVGEKK